MDIVTEGFFNKMADMRILIVEDQEDVGQALELNIQMMNPSFDVALAFDGFEALDILRREPFDLVITDYMMPGMDGLELVETIRSMSPDTKIVFTSALKHKALEDLIVEAEIDHFLPKPFTSNEVRNIVDQVMATVKEARYTKSIVPHQTTQDGPNINPKIDKYLDDLRYQTGAHSCILVGAAGYLLAQTGGDQQIALPIIASLAAANAMATAEISKLLGNDSPFEATVNEGKKYNVASYAMEGDKLLVIIFDRKIKIGLVQHYARRTIIDVDIILQEQEKAPVGEKLDMSTADVDASMDDLFSF